MYISGYVYRECLQYRNRNLKDVKKISWDTNLLKLLEQDLKILLPEIVSEKNEGGVTKFMSKLVDDEVIESVIIPMHTHNTLCVSSQVGCKMGCRFCSTARIGLKRNLEIHEITGQLYIAEEKYGLPIQNIVFMGMGEPFDNFDHVIESIRIFNDSRGFNIPLRRMTLSTSGRVDGIKKLMGIKELNKINLAISLNAPNDILRTSLMPINNTYNMSILKQVLMEYPLKRKETLFIEYVLIKGLNDQLEHASELVEYLDPLNYMVNLIPYNPGTDSDFDVPDDHEIEQFRQYLINKKVTVRKRATRGSRMMAACGQLHADHRVI